MKISKQRRVYAGVLGLAVVAWGVDRFCLTGGPDAASAGMVPAAELAIPSASQSPVGAGPEAPAGIGLAERLDDVRLMQQFPQTPDDAFLVPAEWQPDEARAKAQEVAEPQFDVEGFVKAHKLTAVMLGTDASRNVAVVDGGTILHPGESLDPKLGGMILLEVTREKAVFEHDGVVFELRIERAGSAGVTDGKVGAPSENGGDAGQGR